MLFDWLIDPDSSLQQIRAAFARVRSDIVNAFGWIRYLYSKQQYQERKIEELEKRLHHMERENFRM